MSDSPGDMFGPSARSLQDTFDSRRIADRIASLTVHDALTDEDRSLIEAQSSFLLGTVDEDGWPDVSYKGGEVGFVRVLDPTTLLFPSYDGNGMFRSLGNVADNGRVAMLFVDLARPWRLRVHGRGEVLVDDPLVGSFVGAQAVVRVELARLFPNCGRYVDTGGEVSEFVPRDGHEPPEAPWKKMDIFRPYLPNPNH